MASKFSRILPSAGALAMLLSGPVYAQDNVTVGDDEIVVTGTSIRGIAPAGSSVVALSAEEIEANGALSTNELLADLPQNQNFNNDPQPGAGPGINANTFVFLPRIQLRPLPGINTGGSGQTLILVDGHRLAPVGVSAGGSARVYVDSNAIPPGMLERVEAITDGGSAIYGSDAVSGVVNFITRRRFDGVRVTGDYGFADGYERWGHSLTAGTDWGSGSIFGSYNYAQTDALFGRDRDWIRDYSGALTDDPTDDVPAGRTCDIPTITAGAMFYVPPYNAPVAAPIACDLFQDKGFSPQTFRYSFAGGVSQDLSETVRVDLRGIISRNVSINNNGPYTASGLRIQASNYYFMPALGGDQRATFSFAPAFGNSSLKQNNTSDLWQITPEITWDMGHDWQFRGMLSHGETELAFRNDEIDSLALTTAFASPDPSIAINPYDVASTNPQALALLLRSNAGVGQTQLTDARAIFDGPLFTLPAGEVRGAVGAEHLKTDFELRFTPPGSSLLNTPTYYSQDVNARFAELQVPVVSQDMNVFLVNALTLQGSIRQDTYNDFGDTTNAAYGFTYEPVEWFTLYGNFNESFVAPTATEQAGAAAPATINVNAVADSIDLPNGMRNLNAVITVSGTASPLQPQSSDSYTFGFQVRPPILDGLSVRASFWHTLLMGRLGSLAGCTPDLTNCLYAAFQEGPLPNFRYDFNPTAADVAALGAALSPDEVTGQLAPYIGPGALPVDLILDYRQQNLGRNVVEGWDFGADYVHPTSWGSWNAGLSGTLNTLSRAQSAPGQAWAASPGKNTYNYRASVGADVGNLRAQATMNYTSGRRIPGGRIDSFHPVDLYFAYDVDGTGLTEDVRLSLNVNNAFDDEPPSLELTNIGGLSGFTFGRLIQIGVSKTF